MSFFVGSSDTRTATCQVCKGTTEVENLVQHVEKCRKERSKLKALKEDEKEKTFNITRKPNLYYMKQRMKIGPAEFKSLPFKKHILKTMQFQTPFKENNDQPSKERVKLKIRRREGR